MAGGVAAEGFGDAGSKGTSFWCVRAITFETLDTNFSSIDAVKELLGPNFQPQPLTAATV
jgi:hypothetical protein